jgi:uncharacterized protein (UPF0262 family)
MATGSTNDEKCCLVAVTLDKETIGQGPPDVEHERRVAIYDLLEKNRFVLSDYAEDGPYNLRLQIIDRRLVLAVDRQDGVPLMTHILSMTSLRRIVRDYFLICESYYSAIRTATPSQIEAIDMGRRGLHDEGSHLLIQRLDGKIEVDFETARRLFTLISVLLWKGQGR